ncbi:hypothetical protein E1B28_011612 [Marasmius oreades]|uniref:Uncharacterized protein n=1 Tax=Marasmius oreades TaxID=181124 RepID=A0A9P7UQE6_9AGAR|nr:uncharacterized protein E1B28_011612 [Marasmius oreades]KAG7089990.1 hypothetical protein E1B28_011612 [Marasmius oreades]
MAALNLRETYRQKYLLYMAVRNLTKNHLTPFQLCELIMDLTVLNTIKNTCYLNPRTNVPKAGQLFTLMAEYRSDTSHHHHFVHLLRVSPVVFDVIVALIHDHPVFHNDSQHPQAPVEQ